MNPVFLKSNFWGPYFTLEPAGLTHADFMAQLDALSADFVVEPETEGRNHRVNFRFPCGEPFWLLLEYLPSVNGGMKTLYLVDGSTDTKRQLGWWDLARWHPYCLRLNELDALCRYFAEHDHQWAKAPEVPLLLLWQFVGLCNQEDHDILMRRVVAACQKLNLPISYADRPLFPWDVKADYVWEQDSELGWVFRSTEYDCYSLRNRAHLGSDEGSFPFALFQTLMQIRGAE